MVERPRRRPPPAPRSNLLEHGCQSTPPCAGRVGREPPRGLFELAPGADAVSPARLVYQATATWTSPWKKSRSPGSAARHDSSSASCASKYDPFPDERDSVLEGRSPP